MPFSSICQARDRTPERQSSGEFGRPAALGLGHAAIFGGAGHDLDARHEMGEGGEVLQHDARLGADVILVLQERQGIGDPPGHQRLEEIDHTAAVGEAEHAADVLGDDPPGAMGDGLVEQRQRIARRSFRRARDHGERLVVDLDAFAHRDRTQQADEPVLLDAAQIEALAARQHRHRDLADLGRGEDELHMLRRFLERLQQPVEGRAREHVHLVEDIDLVARGDGLVAHRLDDLADMVDAVVGGGVHLDHIDMAPFHDLGAMDAEFGHVDGRAVHLAGHGIVEAAGEDAGGGRLADAAHAGQHIGLRDAAGRKGIGEGADHRLLADEIVEAARTVFAREHPVGAARLPVPDAAAVHASAVHASALASFRRRDPAGPDKAAREPSTQRRHARQAAENSRGRKEAGTRPVPGSLGLLPSGPDPIGEWPVRHQPPAATYRRFRPAWQPPWQAGRRGRHPTAIATVASVA